MNKTFANTLAGCMLAALSAAPASSWSATVTSTTDYTYETTGAVKTATRNLADAETCAVMTHGRDSFGNVVSSTVANCAGAPASALFTSRTSSRGISSDGRFVTSMTNAMNQVSTITQDIATGQLTRGQKANGAVVEQKLDSLGRVILEKAPDGSGKRTAYLTGVNALSEVWQHVPSGSLQAIKSFKVSGPIDIAAGTTGPAASAVSYVFTGWDGEVMRTLTFGPDGRAIYEDVQYGANREVSARSDPYFAGETPLWKTYEYDKLGRLTKVTFPDNTTERVVYSGLTRTRYDRLNNAIVETLNPELNIKSKSEGSTTASYGYDPMGRLVTFTDPGGAVTTMAYTVAGDLKSFNSQNTGLSTRTRDAIGQVVSTSDAQGYVRSFSYDKLGRQLSVTETSGNSTRTYDGCLNGTGQLCSETGAGGYAAAYEYNAAGRPSKMTSTVGANYTSSKTYDAAGRIDTLVYPSGLALKYLYDSQGYVSAVVNRDSTGWVYWRANASDASLRVTTNTVAEGIGGGSAVRSQLTFDSATKLLKSRQAWTLNSSAFNVMNSAFVWNANSTLASQSEATGVALSASYGYDGKRRLASEMRNGQAMTYGLQDNGNVSWLASAGTLNYPASNGRLAHAVSSVTGTVNGVTNPSFTYDLKGNMLTGAGYTFTWTSFGKPSRIQRTVGTQQRALDYVYNGDSERVQETYSVGGVVQRTTRYINRGFAGGDHYEEEITPAGTTRRHFINVGGVTVGVVTNKPDGTWAEEYWHRDAVGTVKVVTDGATGAVKERLYYDSYGKRRTASDAADPASTMVAATDRGFTGLEMLDEMGLVNANGRIYMPQLARFVSPDPVLSIASGTQGTNAYAYGPSNPWGGSDPNGMSWKSFEKFFKEFSREAFRRSEEKRFRHAIRRVAEKPWEIKRQYELTNAIPGMQTLDYEVMTHRWVYALGKSIATATTWAICLGCGGAYYDGYYTWLATGGDEKAGVRASGVVMAQNGAAWYLEQFGKEYSNSEKLDGTADTYARSKTDLAVNDSPNWGARAAKDFGAGEIAIAAASVGAKAVTSFAVGTGFEVAFAGLSGESVKGTLNSFFSDSLAYGATIPDPRGNRWALYLVGSFLFDRWTYQLHEWNASPGLTNTQRAELLDAGTRRYDLRWTNK